MPNKGRAYSVRIPPNVWEDRKPEILDLYKDHTLCDVCRMITGFDFSPSENQLRAKVTKWTDKKNLTLRERKKINRQIEEAELKVEECEVIVRGRPQPAEKTIREYARACNRDYRGLSPGVPGDIQIRAPPTILDWWTGLTESVRKGPISRLGTRAFASCEKGYRRGLVVLLKKRGGIVGLGRDGLAKVVDGLRSGDWPVIKAVLEEILYKLQRTSLSALPSREEETQKLHRIFQSIQHPIRPFKSRLQRATTHRSPPVDDMDIDMDSQVSNPPALEWSAAERADLGITAEEATREGWRTFFGWED